MRQLGDYLQGKGYGVSGILLPGHGTTPEEMAGTDWPEWFGAVEREYLRLRESYPGYCIVPVGFSMGGILCLHLAGRYRTAGLVSLSAPIYLGNRRAYLAPLYRLFTAYHRKKVAPETWEDELRKGNFSYNRMPVKSLDSLLQLIRTVKRELEKVADPILLMQSLKDETVNPRSAQYLYDHLGSQEKKLVWLEKSGHVITLGMEREEVFREVEAFVQRICPC